MAGLGCFQESDFRALLAGDLPDPIAREVTLHIESCPQCEAIVSRLEQLADPFIRRLQQAVKGSSTEGLNSRAAPTGDKNAESVDYDSKDSCLFSLHLPGYTILKELGRGGMSVVYEARQTRPQRSVAVKMLLAGCHASTEKRLRLLAEAEAIGRLHHPGIVRVFQVGEHEGTPFLVLELMAGGNLAQKTAGRPLAAGKAAELVETLARAIAYAHDQGVIHRDLKPGNVLLTLEGEPRISDFGLAKQERAELTATGDVLGTPSYMAPEQAQGSIRLLGPAADIYALGAILYELLTGRPPFLAATVWETLDQVRSREPLPLRKLTPGIPRDLETICLKCLEKDPGRRYASALALAEDLKRFGDGQPVLARPVGQVSRVWRWCRRNPGWAFGFLVLMGLLVFITVGVSLSTARIQSALTQSREHLWEAYLEEARACRMSRRPGQRFKSLEAIGKALELPVPLGHSLQELRNEAIAALALSDVRVIQEWQGLEEDTNDVDFREDLNVYARVNKEGAISIRRVSDDKELRHLPGFNAKAYYNPVFSPDGSHLVIRNSNSNGGRLWQLDPPKSEPRWECPDGTLAYVAFSPNSRHLAHVDGEGRLALFDLKSGQNRLMPTDGRVRIVCFNPEGDQVMVVTRGRDRDVCRLLNVSTGQVLGTFEPGEAIRGCCWNPNGRMVAVAGASNRLVLWDVTLGVKTRTLTYSGQPIVRLVFNHGGDLLITSSDKLQCWNPHTGQLVFEMNHRSGCLHFSPDDRRLACELSTEQRLVRLHEVAFGREYITLGRGGGFVSPVVNPEGTLIAAGTAEGVRLWDLATGREVAWLGGTEGTSGLLFEADGSALLTSGIQGLWRWPLSDRDKPTGRIGPPQCLWANTTGGKISQSTDCRVLSFCPGLALDRQGLRRPWRAFQTDVESCSVSPDGRLVALGSYSGISQPDFVIYDARDGQRLFVGPVGIDTCDVTFSKDGRWLATSSGGVRLWAVDKWQVIRVIGGRAPAFSPDNRILAVESGSGSIRLVDLATGKDIARLEDPNQINCDSLIFSPDGAHLIAASSREGSLHVWDLSLIQRRLADLGLDWDSAPFAPSDGSVPLAARSFDVDEKDFPISPQKGIAIWSLAIGFQPFNANAYYQRALAHAAFSSGGRDSHRQSAQADLHMAQMLKPNLQSLIEQTPARPVALNSLAWWCVVDPPYFIETGLALAEQAVKRDETDVNLCNTLGVAYYRAGRYREAIAAFEKSLSHSDPGMDAYDLYFLAMCRQKINDPIVANQCYLRAKTSHERNASRLGPASLQELASFRAEANQVLQIAEPNSEKR